MTATAPLEDCLEKLDEFERVETERAGVLREQEAHATELKRIHDAQGEIEARLAAKQAECEALEVERDSFAELIDRSEAIEAALRTAAINERLREIDERLRVIRPMITGDGPVDPMETTNLISEAADLLAERDELLVEHAEKMEIVALYNAAVAEVEASDAEIADCRTQISEIDQEARQNHQAFEDRDIPYQISVSLAETKLTRLWDYQARLIAGNCDAHEEIEIPEVDDTPGTTFEELLAPPDDIDDDDGDEEEFEDVEGEDVFDSDVDIDLDEPDGDEDGDGSDEDGFDEEEGDPDEDL